MTLLDEIRLSLGITHQKLDTEIQAAIQAGKQELSIAGVRVMDEQDALITQAVKIYCRWYFNYQGQAERHRQAFDGMKQALSLCGDYNEVV